MPVQASSYMLVAILPKDNAPGIETKYVLTMPTATCPYLMIA